jgi:hypothetical protein
VIEIQSKRKHQNGGKKLTETTFTGALASSLGGFLVKADTLVPHLTHNFLPIFNSSPHLQEQDEKKKKQKKKKKKN